MIAIVSFFHEPVCMGVPVSFVFHGNFSRFFLISCIFSFMALRPLKGFVSWFANRFLSMTTLQAHLAADYDASHKIVKTLFEDGNPFHRCQISDISRKL